MKTLILLLLTTTMFSQQSNYPIPSNFIGEWVNEAGNDVLTITSESIKWTSNENRVYFSYIDYFTHISDEFYSASTLPEIPQILRYYRTDFSTQPNVFELSLTKKSRNKLEFYAQTDEGLERSSGKYVKQVRN